MSMKNTKQELVAMVKELEVMTGGIMKQNEKLKELCMGMCQQLEDATKHEVKNPDHYYRGIKAVEELQKKYEAAIDGSTIIKEHPYVLDLQKKYEEEIEELNMSVAFWEEKCDHRKERNKELKESLDEIKEQSVPKDFLFAERATADGKICLLKKQVEELKEQGKKDLEEAYLETQYHTWRDEQIDRCGSPDPDAECEYLNLYSNNQQLIKEIFDEIYSDPTERNLSYNVETQKYDEMESDDEE